MESKDHLFIEFSIIGALYMYRREVLNIEQVENFKRRYNNTEGTGPLKKTVCYAVNV